MLVMPKLGVEVFLELNQQMLVQLQLVRLEQWQLLTRKKRRKLKPLKQIFLVLLLLLERDPLVVEQLQVFLVVVQEQQELAC